MAVKNGRVTSRDLARVVEDNHLGSEAGALLRGVVLGVTADVTTTDVLDGDVLDVEANVVTRLTLRDRLVVHLDGLDFSGHTGRGESDDHTRLDDTGLDTADRDSSDTTDLVNILKRKTKRLVSRTDRRLNGVNGLKKSLTLVRALLGLLGPALVPGAVGTRLKHVVTVPTRDGDERNLLGVVTDLLDEVGGLLDDLVVTVLAPLDGVHLVDGDNQLAHTQGEGKKGVLTSLTVLRDTSLELTDTSGNDHDSAVGLRGTSDHVLDEITVARGVNDGDVVLRGLELPEGDIDGDTTLTLGLQLVKYPGVLEGALTKLLGFLLELLDDTLVNTTTLIDQVTGGGRLASIDVANNDEINVSLLFTLLC